MNEWAKDQDIKYVKLIPDGNGEFTEKIGYLVDKSDLGFGKRSWRYSMFVDNGVIKKFFCEPVKEGDPFEVSDADTMLDYLAPNTVRPKVCTIFARVGCPFCAKAKKLLQEHGINYEEVTVARNGITSKTLRAVGNRSTVPVVFIDGKLIGGSEELEQYFANN
jgi:peroxiredoxin (alkyl hydroperoxide reductase subunit C)